MHTINLSVLFLNAMPWLVGIAIGVVAGAAFGLLAFFLYKNDSEKYVGDADERVRKMDEDAKAEADKIKTQGKEVSKRALKEALLEAKELYLK